MNDPEKKRQRREYNRQWRENNREKIREKSRVWAQKWRDANRKKFGQALPPDNAEKGRIASRRRYANPKIRAADLAKRKLKYRADPKYRAVQAARGKEWRGRPEIAARERARGWRRRGLPAPTRPMPSVCECCGRYPNGKGTLHLDHDHVSNKFRGWLCSSCNTAIGKLGDTVVGVSRAVTYLTANL
jgi:hypothetical protein